MVTIASCRRRRMFGGAWLTASYDLIRYVSERAGLRTIDSVTGYVTHSGVWGMAIPACHAILRIWSGNPVLIGYMRVSKADGSQVLDLQRDALIGGGVSSDHLYEDHASGKRDDRPGLDACLKSLRQGDTLVAWKLDRIGRDLRHLVNLVHDLTQRGVGLRVLAGEGAAIDTTTPNGRLMFGFFAALAEFERELIVERTKAGLASARARGRNGGSPFKMTTAKLRLAQAATGQPETKIRALCIELGVSRQTLYRHMNPTGELRPDGEKLLDRKKKGPPSAGRAQPTA